jgi:hypothetical protein
MMSPDLDAIKRAHISVIVGVGLDPGVSVRVAVDCAVRRGLELALGLGIGVVVLVGGAVWVNVGIRLGDAAAVNVGERETMRGGEVAPAQDVSTSEKRKTRLNSIKSFPREEAICALRCL